MEAFHYGLAFAASEHVVKAVVNQLLHYRPREILIGFVHELPSVVAFAFLAGLGANWISDRALNHAGEAIISLLIWFAVLLLSAVVRDDRLWLGSCFRDGCHRRWWWSAFGMSTISLALAITPYVAWHEQADLTRLQVISGAVILSLAYCSFAIVYLCRLPSDRINQCRSFVSNLVGFYSKHSPHDGDGLSVNPSSHRAQSAHYYLGRYYTSFNERQSSTLCSCRENDLVKRVQGEIVASTSQIRNIVRSEIKSVADACELEFWILVYIVASNEQAKVKAADIVNKSTSSIHLEEYDAMRQIVERSGKLISINIGL